MQSRPLISLPVHVVLNWEPTLTSESRKKIGAGEKRWMRRQCPAVNASRLKLLLQNTQKE